MSIFVDNNATHGDDNVANNTVPPGITGLDWCHVISDVSKAELDAFLDDNPSIGQPSSNVRTPALGSNITYAGLDPDMRDAAIAAGATVMGRIWVLSHSFDQGPGSWEP